MKLLFVVSLALLVGATSGFDLFAYLEDYIGDKIRQQQYQVSFDTILPGIPMLKNLNLEELPSWRWLETAATRIGHILAATFDSEQAQQFQDVEDDGVSIADALLMLHGAVTTTESGLNASSAHELIRSITVAAKTLAREKADADIIASSLLTATLPQLIDMLLTEFIASDDARPDTYDGYPKLFEPLLDHFPEPETNWELPIDEAFGRLRVAGYVPFQLRKVEPKLLEDMKLSQYSGNSSDLIERVETALLDGRLYGVDYSFLAGLTDQEGKFGAPMVGLFEIPKDEEEGKRVGVRALSLQITKGVATSIFTPADGEWVWKYAKSAFNAAESVYHAAGAHLAHTHLVPGVFMLSVKRVMSADHPIRKLVDPHVEGTAQINYLAEKILVADGNVVDILLPKKVDETRAFVSELVLDRLSQNLTWPAFMESAGLTEEQFPVKYYPYRDYAGKLWKAYHRWVGRYLRLVYPTDAEMNEDRDVEQLRKELIANKVAWVETAWAENEGTVELLTDVITSFVFIGSVGHAAVNFAQGSMTTAVGTVPMSLYSPLENSAESLEFEEDVLKSLPPVRESQLQQSFFFFLSTQHIDVLEGYADPEFDTTEMVLAAKDFHQDLVDIEQYQNEQNAEAVSRWESVDKPEGLNPEHWAYKLLLPSLTPMSINI